VPNIAVFDSGIGGLGVLGHLRNRAPWADIVYVGDHAFGPYGERTLEEVRHRTSIIAEFVRSAGVEIVTIACNSASAAALRYLRETLPDISFVGMEPAVKPAAAATSTGTVAVLATAATFQGDLFADLVGTYADDIRIIEQACPGLAAAIENGLPVDDLLDRYLTPVRESDADVVVLGCTHYPLIEAEIRHRLPGVTMIDPAPAVAARVIDLAHDRGIDLKQSGVVDLWTTGVEEHRSDEWSWRAVDVPATARAAIRIGDTTITAVEGDITGMEVDAIVNAANVALRHGGGVAAAISAAGGPTIQAESDAWIAEHGRLPPGVAAITSGGRMPATYVIHTAGPVWIDGEDNETLLAAAVLAALDTATEMGLGTIAMPAISAGIFRYPADEATAVIAETVAAFASETDSAPGAVRLVGYDDMMADRFATALRSMAVDVR
jgi:glutamate racemase